MTARHTVLGLASLLFLAPEVEAQIPQVLRHLPRAGLTPAETRPAIGVLGGPTSRAADADTGGGEFALFGEMPIDTGWRVRAELGGATWDMAPTEQRSASQLTLTRGTVGIYRVHGRGDLHSFIGGAVGLYRHRLSGAADSSLKGGAHIGMGAEYDGRRMGFATEVRVALAPNPTAHGGGTLHASVLFGLKRVFRAR